MLARIRGKASENLHARTPEMARKDSLDPGLCLGYAYGLQFGRSSHNEINRYP